jgi:hypothetical protein
MPLILGTIASPAKNFLSFPAYESIGTFAPTTGTTSVTFSSIPSTYKHLQLRLQVINPANGGFPGARVNGDTGANYAEHYVYGNASPPGAGGAGGGTSINLGGFSYGLSATAMRVVIADILDYASTNKWKTFKMLTGIEENGAGEITFNSGLWRNTAAINSLTIIPSNGFKVGSHVALYGVK